MIAFIKYGLFYNRLTEGRIFIFIALSLFAGICETLFVLAVLPIVELNQKTPGKISSFIYGMLENYGITTPGATMLSLIAIALVCILLASAGTVAAKFYIAWLQGFLLRKIQVETIPKIFQSDYSYLISQSTGYLNNAIMQQIPNSALAFKQYATIIGGIIMTTVYLVVPMAKNPAQILILALLLSPAALVLKFFNSKNRFYSVRNAEAAASLNGILLQIIGAFKYLKSTATLDKTLEKTEKEVGNVAYIMRKVAVWGGTCNDVLRPYAMFVILGMLYFSVVIENTPIMEAGAMFGLLYMAYQKSVVIPMAYQKFLSSTGAIKVYESITRNLRKHPDPYADAKGKPLDFNSPIVMRDVYFQYPTAKEPAIRHISLEIPPRSTVGIVGESGSGKSTLANLITALLRPDSGDILLGDTPYSELDIHALRASMGYITQEPVVFNDTVKNNITLWNNQADMDAIIAAAKKAHAHDFIMAMPDGYDTLLGDNGINVSGGQRQRLGIARELFRNPPVLILDEATSALDTATEKYIQREIDEMKGERTIVVIAHRLSTIKNCDVVFVLDNGEVVERGPYDELIRAGGPFQSMIAKQNLEKG